MRTSSNRSSPASTTTLPPCGICPTSFGSGPRACVSGSVPLEERRNRHMVRHEDGPVYAADTAPEHQEPSVRPPCYLPEKDNPYPLCIGRGMRICAHCCLWANYDPSEDERRVNQPLPLALLREMDGQPAWWECGPKNSGWGIISVDSGGYWKGCSSILWTVARSKFRV